MIDQTGADPEIKRIFLLPKILDGRFQPQEDLPA